MIHKTARRPVVEVNGARFVMVEEGELQRLERLASSAPAAADDGEGLPPLPPADAEGNRPAAEYIRASIARDIVRERRAAGLTQHELAKLAGTRVETISRLESGKHSPTMRTLDKIENALQKALKKRSRSAIKGSAVKRK